MYTARGASQVSLWRLPPTPTPGGVYLFIFLLDRPGPAARSIFRVVSPRIIITTGATDAVKTKTPCGYGRTGMAHTYMAQAGLDSSSPDRSAKYEN
jgi:hypothetical protein